MRLLLLSCLTLGLASLTGCGSTNTCIPGQSVTCTGANVCTGSQVCAANGTFGPCSCASADDGADSGTQLTRAQTILSMTGVSATGQTVYLQQCVSCHGAAGDAVTPNTDNKSMVAYVKANTAESVVNIVINGVPMTAMVSFAALSDQNMADLFAYVKGTLAK